MRFVAESLCCGRYSFLRRKEAATVERLSRHACHLSCLVSSRHGEPSLAPALFEVLDQLPHDGRVLQLLLLPGLRPVTRRGSRPRLQYVRGPGSQNTSCEAYKLHRVYRRVCI